MKNPQDNPSEGAPHWRLAEPEDDATIVALCLALYTEDPGTEPVSAEQVRHTLDALRREPVRGRVLVLEADGRTAGYALLVSFWSNELGGEIRTLDELYVLPENRGRGHVTSLVEALARGEAPWPGQPVALELEVSPTNSRARALYERLGFTARRNATLRLRLPRR